MYNINCYLVSELILRVSITQRNYRISVGSKIFYKNKFTYIKKKKTSQ